MPGTLMGVSHARDHPHAILFSLTGFIIGATMGYNAGRR